MKKTRRKHSSQSDFKAIRARDRKGFIERIRIICGKMVGAEYFDLYPARVLHNMYGRRYPSLKVLCNPVKGISEQDTYCFEKLFFN